MRLVRILLLPLLFVAVLFIPTAAAATPTAVTSTTTHSAWVVRHHYLEVKNQRAVHRAKVKHAHSVRVAAAHRRWLVTYMAPVIRVGECEEPLTSGGRIVGVDWTLHGSKFSGGLGWLQATWDQFKAAGDPYNMGDASPLIQAKAMHRFANTYYWPDTSGCSSY